MHGYIYVDEIFHWKQYLLQFHRFPTKLYNNLQYFLGNFQRGWHNWNAVYWFWLRPNGCRWRLNNQRQERPMNRNSLGNRNKNRINNSPLARKLILFMSTQCMCETEKYINNSSATVYNIVFSIDLHAWEDALLYVLVHLITAYNQLFFFFL